MEYQLFGIEGDTYDAAIETAKANGYDRWTEIVQGAYDRYISKFEN